MALRNRNCRDLARGSGVQFVVDDVAMQVVEIGVSTTQRPITVTLFGTNGTSTRTQQPMQSNRYDVSVDLLTVTEVSTRGLSWPFMVQF